MLLLGLLCLGLFGLRLGSSSLPNPDESRYAEIPREMLATGDWVTPRLNGVNYFEKPPLVYWAVAANQGVFGANEWAIRAVPALFALGGVLLTYAATRRLYGRNAGLAAGFVLATALLYFALARILLLDMAVSVLMSAALFCFILGVQEPAGGRRRWLFYGVYASMALATLTKGLIGFLVTGAVMFLWLLVFNQWRRLRPFYLPTGALLFLALAAPWHVLAALRNETWAHRYFVYEHWERFTSPAASRPGPWWYFIPIVVAGLFPWTGFLWPALRAALPGGWTARKENANAWFFVTWAAFIFLFFSKSHSKLPPYILPVFPPLAVLIGAWLARPGTEDPKRLRAGLVFFTGFSALLGIALAVVVLYPGRIIRDPIQALALRPYAFALAAIALAGGALTLWLELRRSSIHALRAMAVTAGLFYATLTFAVPDIQRPGTSELARIVKARAQPADRVVNYHEFFHDFAYYSGRVVDVVDGKGELELEEDAAARASGRFIDDAEFRRRWTGPVRLWVVAEKEAVTELFADRAFRYYLLGETRSHYLFSNQP
ncbi:4-amino-4-deoxy-L-arabinose transferase [Opitutus sp. GAS368]|nr:4-amino-4-deoxy-L-arabinose transferase [Opitutus sp. GAS368]